MDIVDETYRTDGSKADHEPRVLKSEKCGIQPCPYRKYYAATPQGDTGVGAAQIGLVDDVESVRYSKIKKLRYNEQSQDSGIRYPPGHKVGKLRCFNRDCVI